MYTYRVKRVIKVIDGDTFDFEIDLGFKVFTHIRVRLEGYDTPEIRGSEKVAGKIYKSIVQEIFDNAVDIMITTHKKGKYGRWIAYVEVDESDLILLMNDVFQETYGVTKTDMSNLSWEEIIEKYKL